MSTSKTSGIRSSRTGFTLVEVIVATALFAAIVLIVSGSLLGMLEASRKARSMRTAVENFGAAFDSISRTVRMGSVFHCGCTAPFDTTASCPMSNSPNAGGGGGDCFAVESENGSLLNAGDQIVYRLSGNRLQRSTDSGTTWLNMTAPEIRIDELKFYVDGVTRDADQPYVVIRMSGGAGAGKTATEFDVQTTIAMWTPNFRY